MQLGDALDMEFTLDVFVGYRIGIFCYSQRSIGGYADFKGIKTTLEAIIFRKNSSIDREK